MPDVVNIASDSIFVFPTVSRSTTIKFARSPRLFTEENVRDIAKMVNSKDSYVIGLEDNQLEFCLGGYHVIVSTSALPDTLNNKSVYAVAKFDKGNLLGDTTDNKYAGVDFDESKPTSGTYLLLGTKTSDGFTVSKESEIMYDGARVDSTALTLIDGGEA